MRIINNYHCNNNLVNGAVSPNTIPLTQCLVPMRCGMVGLYIKNDTYVSGWNPDSVKASYRRAATTGLSFAAIERFPSFTAGGRSELQLVLTQILQ